MQQNNKQKPDVYQMVTDRIVAALEKGIVPWRQPWKTAGLPQNLVTGKVYRGINFWLLLSLNYNQNFFLSYKQIKELGGKIKEGEKSHIIVFWKQISLEDNETGEKQVLPFLRYYQVYNIEQCDGIPLDNALTEDRKFPIKLCEDIVAEMPDKPIIRHKDARAYYNPLRDFVNMPQIDSFESSESYYATLFHELVHSTGHVRRLNRKELLQMAEFGSEPYSVEELTAEIGACYLKTLADIDKDELQNSASYIHGWLQRLKNDKRCIVYASTQAQKATDFILNIRMEATQQTTNEEQPTEEGETVF